MKPETRRIGRLLPSLSVLFVALLALASGGCLAAMVGGAAAGGAGYAYYHGNMAEVYDADLPLAYEATQQALKDLALPVTSEKRDNMTGTIETVNGKYEKVTITMEQQMGKIPTDPPKTKVAVRVGTFGDAEMSRRMQQQIAIRMRGGANFPAAPPTGTEAQPAAWKPSAGAPTTNAAQPR
jgi:uncharacterized protein DUF3568